jgi:alkylation response protein AidB-like acyl-CoA dehydrogenase
MTTTVETGVAGGVSFALTPEQRELRALAREFAEKEIRPKAAEYDEHSTHPADVVAKAHELGLMNLHVPESLGGLGLPAFDGMLVGEELNWGCSGIATSILANGLGAGPVLLAGSDEQKATWLPPLLEEPILCSFGLSEPDAGSDVARMKTTAERRGDEYVLNGSKTFITNGINADLVITAVKTDPSQRHAGMSLLVLERGMEGFERGRNLEKVGLHAQDTAELFFTDVRVPVENLLGTEGHGFRHLVQNLPQERLSIAAAGVAAARAALQWTLAYCKERRAFGQPVGSFQNSRFRLAELATEVEVGQAFVDRCVVALNAGELTAEEAAMAKLWCTELQGRAVDVGVQLHGGYGYMTEYPIARAYADARITRIYGGTNEVMREIVGRSLGV